MSQFPNRLLPACLFAGMLLAGCQAGPFARVVIDPPRTVATSMPDADQSIDWQPLDRVLKKYVADDGRVAYFQLVYDGALADLQAVYGKLARTGPVSHPQIYPTRSDRLAYYINAHNLLALVSYRLGKPAVAASLLLYEASRQRRSAQ